MTTSVLGPAFSDIIIRELDRLVRLIEAYPDEADLWRIEGSATNSAGTLALHLAGNLEHFVGAGLGGSSYIRDRVGEFGDRDVPRSEIVRRIRACQDTMRDALTKLPDATLLAAWPAPLPPALGEDVPAANFLAHLTWHLGWHLGQIDYHRRILVGGDPV